MKWAVVVLLCIGAALAQDDQCCGQQDKKELARIWRHIWSAEFTGRRVQVGQSVFEDLFENNPGAVGLFARVKGDDIDSNEFKAHCVRVVNGLDTAINLLGRPGVLREELAHLNTQHKSRDGVAAAHFDALEASFMRVMPQVSSCFNPGAFQRCFRHIAGGISAGLP